MLIPGVSPLLLRAGLNYQLRHRWQALLALVGIVMGVAVVLAVDLANGAARASFALSAEQLRGAATHRIIGNTGEVSQALYTQLFTSPGHPPMAPVITAKVQIDGYQGRSRLVGLDLFSEGQFRQDLPSAIKGEVSLAEWFSNPQAIAMSQLAADSLGLVLNDRLDIKFQGIPYRLKIVAISPSSSAASRDILVVDIATAQAITDQKNTLSHIDLILDESAISWLKPRLPASVKLVDVEQQMQGVVGLSASFELNLTAMSLLALLVGLFLIFNAMSFSIVQRRNLLGRLRALGVSRQEIYRVILAEAFVLGILGTVIGWLLGFWLGQGLTKIVAATVSELYYEVSADAMQLSWFSFFKASLLGLVGTLVATWIPARQAANTPPLTTLSRAELEHFAKRQIPALAIAGGLLTVIGLLVAFLLPGGVVSGFVGLFILLIGAALITPLGLPMTHALLSRLPFGGIWRMAIRDLNRHLSRLGTAAAALMVALAATVGVALMVDSMRGSVSDWLQDLLSADLYIAAEGFHDDAYLPHQVVLEASKLKPVSDISLYRDNSVLIGRQLTRLVAAQLAQQSRNGFDLVDSVDADAWVSFDRGDILISEPLAYRLKIQPGEQLVIPAQNGDKKFRVAAIFRDYASEHGRVFMNLKQYRQNWSDPHIDTLALFSSSVSGIELQQAASEAFDDEYKLQYTRAKDIYNESMAVFDRTFRITEVLRLLSIMVAFIGILSALMAVQLERKKEFAILRALGLTRVQVSLLIMIESAILGLLAALFAIPTGLALAWVLTDAIQLRAFGWTMPFMITASPLLWTLILGVSAALLASLYPAWQASRGDPAPQMRED